MIMQTQIKVDFEKEFPVKMTREELDQGRELLQYSPGFSSIKKIKEVIKNERNEKSRLQRQPAN